jgi:methylmalonyl-CoA decarboxylase
MTYIRTDFSNSVGTITFNNDSKRNSLNSVMINEIIDAFHLFREQKARVAIMRANPGAKVWSAGFDISELPQAGRDPLTYNDPIEILLREIQRFPAPVIAMVEGSVWGGACDIAFVCDMILGTYTSSFAITPAKIGVPYNPSGVLHFVNMVGLHLAKEMFFTALPINAQQAKHHGILNHLAPSLKEMEEFTQFIVDTVMQNSPLSISVIKEQLRILSISNNISPETFEWIQGLRRKVYDSEDYKEGISAFLEKRKPVFRGE